MKYEPPIDRVRLLETVRTAYGLPVEGLDFVPVGFAAVCYTLHAARGARYFLKLWPDTLVGHAQAAHHAGILRLTHALAERELYPRVPAPLPTLAGELWAPFAGAVFAIFPFLTGQAQPAVWPHDLQDTFAHTIAQIHRATPALADVLPPRETFDIPFEADLRRSLAVVAQIGPGDRPGLQALRAFVLPRREEIAIQLARLHRLQHNVRRLAGLFVLCHTDIGGDNLLVDDQGQVWVLDWDDATVAPPEHDLHEARWLDFGRIIEQYQAAGGVACLHLDHFAFVLQRRFLGDMTVRLLRLLAGTTSDEADADALDGMQAWGFAQWAALDETLDGMAAVLRHRPS